MFTIHEVTETSGRSNPELLARAETVHRQLRPQLEADYPAQMRRVFAGGGRMIVAAAGERVAGVAVWRILLRTHSPQDLYVDDLVTDNLQRSTGIGRAMLGWLENRARELGCSQLCLDSGTHRQQAHKFYFREGLTVTAFHFVKPLR